MRVRDWLRTSRAMKLWKPNKRKEEIRNLLGVMTEMDVRKCAYGKHYARALWMNSERIRREFGLDVTEINDAKTIQRVCKCLKHSAMERTTSFVI